MGTFSGGVRNIDKENFILITPKGRGLTLESWREIAE
jgi:hypothetical protein